MGVQGFINPPLRAIKEIIQMLMKYAFLACTHCLYHKFHDACFHPINTKDIGVQIKPHAVLCLNLDHLLC